jgi:predicted ABC-type transport system involved in lysophospholipase L1 biosynthesis ATPase subunit
VPIASASAVSLPEGRTSVPLATGKNTLAKRVFLVALVGLPPGSGKSTLSDALVAALDSRVSIGVSSGGSSSSSGSSGEGHRRLL